MNKSIQSLLLAGLTAIPATAQGYKTQSTYLKASIVIPQDDLRLFAGGKSNGYGFELGREFRAPGDSISVQVYVGFLRLVGDHRDNLQTSFDTRTYILGADLKYDLPWKLTAFAGASANHWRAFQTTDSPVLGLKGKVQDSRAKVGFRAGLEYTITDKWSVSASYNFGEWRSALGAT